MEGEILRDVEVSLLKENPKNPRIHTNLEAIKRSIIVNGFRTPVIVDENNVILAGRGRLLAIKEMGWEKVPLVVKYLDLTEQQKVDFMIRDNKTTELAQWDASKLYVDYDPLQLKDWGFDILRIKPEDLSKLKLAFEVNRNMDYIVVFFDNPTDFVYMVNKLELPEVMNPKNKKLGRARLVDAKKVIGLFK